MVSVSILNGDLARLAETAADISASGAEYLHFDVMDGCFVDNISFGLPVLESLDGCTDLPLDVHLMICDPLHYAERFCSAGADILTFHIESDSDAAEVIRTVHQLGVRVGIAVSPATPIEKVYPYLDLLTPEDLVLVMTVVPGLGGQSFMPETVQKIRDLRSELQRRGRSLHIEVDGGINAETGAVCRNAGADILVAGSYLLRAENMKQAVASLRDGV